MKSENDTITSERIKSLDETGEIIPLEKYCRVRYEMEILSDYEVGIIVSLNKKGNHELLQFQKNWNADISVEDPRSKSGS